MFQENYSQRVIHHNEKEHCIQRSAELSPVHEFPGKEFSVMGNGDHFKSSMQLEERPYVVTKISVMKEEVSLGSSSPSKDHTSLTLRSHFSIFLSHIFSIVFGICLSL